MLERIDEVDFLNMKEDWGKLIHLTDANPLFMGWAWLASWWVTWSRDLDLELLIISIKKDNVLVGLAPLYIKNSTRWPLKDKKDLYVLGNAWSLSPTVRTEYVDIIAEHDLKDQVLLSVYEYLEKIKWDRLVISDHVVSEPSKYKKLITNGRDRHFLIKKDTGVALDVVGEFDWWKSSLSNSFRLKVFNRREYLSGKGSLEFIEAQPKDFGFYFDQLNRLHRTRWGTACFEKLSLEFHKRFVSLLDSSQKVRFSSLRLNGQIESILYDVQAGDKIYNLQAGFNEKYDKKVSLGTLHLGYAIERAFNDPKVRQYDLLAGGGKNTYYKQHFKGDEVEFFSVVLVRNPRLKLVYSTKQRLLALLRKPG